MTRFERFRRTIALRLWAYRSIRLLAYVRPSIVEDSPQRCVIRVPLSRRTRNHLGSMYFGALCTGADAAAAWIALSALRRHPGRFSILFKQMRAEFLRRAEGAVEFSCEQVSEIGGVLEKARASGIRESLPVVVTATVPTLSGAEPVARFELTLSVKRRDPQT